MICKHCGTVNRDDAKYCDVCGQPLCKGIQFCENCGRRIKDGDNFCTYCGWQAHQPKYNEALRNVQQRNTMGRNPKGRKTWLIILIVAVITALAGVAVIAFLHPRIEADKDIENSGSQGLHDQTAGEDTSEDVVFRSIGAMLTTGGGPAGRDWPEGTEVREGYIGVTYGNDGDSEIWFAETEDGERISVVSSEYSLQNVITDGETFFYQEWNWDSQTNDYYMISDSGEREELDITGDEATLAGFYNGKLFYSVETDTVQIGEGDVEVPSHEIRALDVETGQTETVLSNFNAIQSYDRYLLLEKDVDSGNPDMYNTRYVYNIETDEINELPVKHCISYITPSGVYNYEYSFMDEDRTQLSRCDYDGKNKTIIADGFLTNLWLGDTQACIAKTEEEYFNGVTYLVDYETGDMEKRENTFED